MTNIETWRYQYRNNYQAARYLLANEAQGFAIDATQNGTGEAIAAYTGGPIGGTITVKSASDAADVLISKSLDASNLVQSGTSPKMVHWNSAPYVRWTPHNILLQSQTLGTTWSPIELSVSGDTTAAPDGTMTAEKLVESGAIDVHQLNQSYTTAAVVVTFSAYLKAAERTHACLTLRTDSAQRYGAVFDLSNGTVTDTEAENGIAGTGNDIISVGNGWYRCSITILSLGANDTAQISPSDSATPTFIQAVPTYDGDGTSGIYAWGAQVNRGYYPTPYLATTTVARIGIPQEYDTAASKFGILVEPAVTNLILRSEDIATTWTAGTGVTIAANDTTAPDGSTTADKYTYSGADEYISQNVTKNVSTTHSFSLFAKASTGAQWIMLVIWDGSGHGSQFWFDILNGAVGSTGSFGSNWTPSNIAITSVGDGWYRCSGTTTTGAGTTLQYKFNSATANSTDTRDTTFVCWLWGMQVAEEGVATSYIPTLGATVTRATDNLTVATSSFPLDNTANSVIVHAKPLGDPASTDFNIVTIRTDDNNRVQLFHATAANIKMFVSDTGATQVNGAGGTVVTGTAYKTGYSYTTDDLAIYQNGSSIVTDATCTWPNSLSTVTIGTSGSTGLATFNQRIYQLKALPRAIGTTALGTETT